MAVCGGGGGSSSNGSNPNIDLRHVADLPVRAINMNGSQQAQNEVYKLENEDIQFKEEPSRDFFCPICLDLLQDPFQMQCCGTHVCRDCIGPLKYTPNATCFHCRENGIQANEDKFFKRQILNLKVRCYYHKEGCKWEGELRDLMGHIKCDDSHLEGRVAVACACGCGESMKIPKVAPKQPQCMKLPTNCKYCDYKGPYDVVTRQHGFECKSFPVQCPNNSSVLPRQKNCPVRFMRDHLPKHLEEACQLRVLSSPKPVEVKVANGTVGTIPVTFTMTKVLQRKRANEVWYSPPFFHTKNGYKMQLRVYPNGLGKSKSTHISVYVLVRRGEHDDSNQWPVYGEMTISVLNRRSEKGHFMKQIYFPGDGACDTLTNKEISFTGPGYHDFFPHSLLSYRKSSNTRYLVQDQLCLRVVDMKVFPPPPCPCLPRMQPGNHLCHFTVKGFDKCKQTKIPFYSPPFYTSERGYRMCMQVYSESSCNENLISVSAHLMKGEHDHTLQWPLNADLSIKLINWRADKQHLVQPLYINDWEGEHSSQVREQEMASKGSGSCQLTLTMSSADVQYLQNGCLHFVIGDLVFYSTNPVFKVPSWCSAAQSHSVHAFTLADFTKRKQFNNRYFSAPFYSHTNGYKMRLRVDANGHDKGTGSHVSIFCQLIKGDHDDSLEWPFRGTVLVELLNWNRDSGHQQHRIHFNDQADVDACSKPIEGKGKQSWGTYSFISHDMLLKGDPLDDTKRFIQRDCLRFQVKEVIVFSAAASKTPKIPAWQNLKAVNPAIEFTLAQFSKHKQANSSYLSPIFYSHQNGYKMRLEVQANGCAEAQGTHVSVFSGLMKGEHDDSLIWPFQADITVELLNWKQNLGHHACTTEFDGATPSQYVRRVTEGEYGSVFGHRKFIAHADLCRNQAGNIQYLMDDCLRFRVKSIMVHSNPLMHKIPRWQGGMRAVQFTVNNFTYRMRNDSKFISTPFYSHQNGYKFRLEVYAGGHQEFKGSYVAAFVVLMAGEHDNTLQWPLEANIAIDLLNWKKGSNHHRHVITFGEDTAIECRSRVTEGEAAQGWGTFKLIDHNQLFPRYASDVEYREDDCLCFRITDMAIYSTSIFKVPYWQKKPSPDALCEFTVTQFSKRQQYGSVYWSKPFYSHKKGYNLRLQIRLNGMDEGKGSHIGVYAQAVPGEFDNRQKWPACVRVNVVLLNWKRPEARWHHSQAIRCVSKNPTSSGTFGTHTFIPHATLRHPPAHYISYLEDDCLRFQVSGTIIYSRKGIF